MTERIQALLSSSKWMNKVSKQSTLTRVTIFPRWLPATKLSIYNSYQQCIRRKLFSLSRKFSVTEKIKHKYIYLHFTYAKMAASPTIHELSFCESVHEIFVPRYNSTENLSHLGSARFDTQSSRILSVETGKELWA